jgi:CheY-like chemotaxis protein
VVVADSGVGIARDFLPSVFDIFRQQEQGTRREYQGLGIGLSLVKKLVELHKGRVGVASAGAGRGTEVTVTIPLAAERPELEAPPAGAEPTAIAGLSILVVEDSDDTRESMKDLLQLLGVTVAVARDGREALDMIREVDPDVVLCDLRMPRMDGYEFIRELQRADSPVHPPVVAVSGFVNAADRQRTRDAGFAAHIRKPFDQAALVAGVGAALCSRQARPLPAA